MLKCCSLFSGSSGNSFFIQSLHAKILIDVGVSCKKIETALKENFNLNLKDINAILITHEHIDHTKSLNLISNKYNIPVYATTGTWSALGETKVSNENKNIIKLNNSFNIMDIRIFPFETPHDAVEPCGFNIYDGDSKISIATDIGHIDETLFNHLKQSSFIMLESNYEPNILKYSSYPYILKKRISGDSGHLSNIDAGKAISKLIDYGLKEALLIHLSKENNVPEIAYQSIQSCLSKTNQNINIHVAPRDNLSHIFNI